MIDNDAVVCHPTVIHYPRGDTQAVCDACYWVSDRYDSPALAWESAKAHEQQTYAAVMPSDNLRAIKDPVARILASEKAMWEARSECKKVRGQAIRELLEQGHSMTEVAAMLTAAGRSDQEISRQRVFQMLQEADE